MLILWFLTAFSVFSDVVFIICLPALCVGVTFGGLTWSVQNNYVFLEYENANGPLAAAL